MVEEELTPRNFLPTEWDTWHSTGAGGKTLFWNGGIWMWAEWLTSFIGGATATTSCSAAPANVLIGGPGNDILDGGEGDDIVIQLVGGDTVTSAAAADKEWLAKHARIVDGKTVLEVGGKQRTLPRVDLTELLRSVTGS